MQLGEQHRLLRAPGVGGVGGRRRQRQAAQQRRGLGAHLGGALEADADLLVQHLDQRRLALLAVTLLEILAKAFEALEAQARREAAQQVDAALDLGDHLRSEVRLGRRLDHVDLEEPRHLHLRRQRLEVGGDRPIALGRGADAAVVERGERVAGSRQAPRGFLPGLEPCQVADEVVDGLRPGDRRRQVRNQHLAVDQLRQEDIGLLPRDLELGIGVAARVGRVGGHQRRGQVGGARAAARPFERGL